MARVGAYHGKDIGKILLKKGFVLKRRNGSHYIFRDFQTGDTIVIPVHPRDLPRGTQQGILKRAGIIFDDH